MVNDNAFELPYYIYVDATANSYTHEYWAKIEEDQVTFVTHTEDATIEDPKIQNQTYEVRVELTDSTDTITEDLYAEIKTTKEEFEKQLAIAHKFNNMI